MLVLKRKEGQWVEIVHRSGDVIRIRVYDIQQGGPSRANLAFDDDARNFEIRRPERKVTEPRPVAPAGIVPAGYFDRGYGFCPRCGEAGVDRERRLGGNDRCAGGCVYPSAEAVAAGAL